MKRNMFIVNVEGPDNKDLPSANGVKQVLDDWWKNYSNVKFQIEEGGHREVAKLVSDYLDAEQVLDKFESMNGISSQHFNSEVGHKWKALYDDVRAKRITLVSKLRQYAAII